MANKNLKEARRTAQEYLEGKRDSNAEEWIKQFVNKICKEQRVESPEVIVVEDPILLEFAGTSKAVYRYPEETIYVGADWPALAPVTRELHRHIEFKKHGDANLKKLSECLAQGTPQAQCPTEIARDDWIRANADRLYDIWSEAQRDYAPPGAGTLGPQRTQPI